MADRRGGDAPGQEGPPAVVVEDVRRRFGTTVALDGASFSVRRGAVTGFLGPNGAGKTTAIRIILGLDRADAGDALVLGRRFRDLEEPARRVGALLDGAGFHPGRTGRDHLRTISAAIGVPDAKADELLATVGLANAARRRVEGYSLGMRRRLGLASALLGDPEILILDEPTNGLDPAGIRWLRETLRRFTAAGGTVLVSSHVLGEVAHTADDVVVINQGRVVAQTSVAELTTGAVVVVRTPQPASLRDALHRAGATTVAVGEDGLEVTGMAQEQVGFTAADVSVPVIELRTRTQSLEDVFFDLTAKGA